MIKNLTRTLAAAAVFGLTPAWGGPPLVCERIDIGNAQSLPWRNVEGWQGTDPAYDVSKLSSDTLALLKPETPIKVRMETLRRAALYAAAHTRLADEVASKLLARTLDGEAAGKADALAWFDAGYFVETVRQATFVYRYDMLSPAERAAWKLRGDNPRLDGYAWIRKAIRLGGKGMDLALSKVEEYRRADLQRVAAR